MTMPVKGAKPWDVSIVDEVYKFIRSVPEGIRHKWLFITYDCQKNNWGALFSEHYQPFNKPTITADNYKDLLDKLRVNNDLREISFPPEELMTEEGLKKLSEEYCEYVNDLGDEGPYGDLVVRAIAG